MHAVTLTLTLRHGAGVCPHTLTTYYLPLTTYHYCNHLLYLLQVVLSLGMTHVASTLLSGALMDRAGRRPLLLVSIALMCAGLQGTAHARGT